ncbi:AAA family ATPase, partial [Lacticaseibacillus paracasei]
MLYGESGSGKSFMALQLAGAIARGVEWRGRRVKQGRVVYIAAEGAGGFRNRCVAYAQAEGIALADLPLGIVADAPNL